MLERHHSAAGTSAQHFPLKIVHNCFPSRIALPLHHFYNQTIFPASTGILSALSPNSIYPFPYRLQLRGQVVPIHVMRSELTSVSAPGTQALALAPVPFLFSPPCPSRHMEFCSPAKVSLCSICQVFLKDWRSITALCYSKPCQWDHH